MEINWSIAGWIIAVLVLYTIGFYEGRANGYKRRQREEEQEKLKTPPAQVDDPGVLRIKNENGILLSSALNEHQHGIDHDLKIKRKTHVFNVKNVEF